MAEPTQGTPSLWDFLSSIVHIKPYFWLIIDKCGACLMRLVINPALDGFDALILPLLLEICVPALMALHAICGTFLMVLEPITEPLLILGRVASGWLHIGVYIWAVGVLLYKIEWMHASSTCSEINWSNTSAEKIEGACAVSATLLTMVSVLWTVVVGCVFVDFWLEQKKCGTLRAVLRTAVGLMATSLCLYPSARHTMVRASLPNDPSYQPRTKSTSAFFPREVMAEFRPRRHTCLSSSQDHDSFQVDYSIRLFEPERLLVQITQTWDMEIGALLQHMQIIVTFSVSGEGDCRSTS